VAIGPRKIGVNVHPKEGQKINGILNNLDSISVHIQASGTITGIPVPAEGAVRLEIPHGDIYTVGLRSAFEANGDLLRTPLHIPLGVTTEMEHETIDLLEQHHLLVAGATGSGKSNFLSTVIASLAIGNGPETVQMSILDPKGLDFGKFETLPHVDRYIDDPNESATFLTDLLDTEVEERRSQLQKIGASSVKQYNELAESRDLEKIPYRVILIDEYADLSMAVDDESKLEAAVTRLAQIGRALGYSILLATQRPDAEIVSGKIKTNFQPRIAFELPTGTDSRVILDQNGAEDLQGDGDMIAKDREGAEYRLQGYYLPLEDALAVIDWITNSE
jgi:S-DNA-T family DNA segregation ATPase FtsK/SpoIIIE